MNKYLKFVSVLATGYMLVACSSLKLSQKDVSLDGRPMAVHAQRVKANIYIRFAPESFPKEGRLRITPVLRFRGDEVAGQSYFYQGEEVRGNDVVIPYKEGENVKMNLSVPYRKAMKGAVLFLQLNYSDGSRTKLLPEIKVSEGVCDTEALAVVADISPAFAPDGFQRIINESYDANILFRIQDSNVRSSELKKDEIKEWTYLVENAKEMDDMRVNVEVQSYASPDGNEELNEKLSEAREKNTSSLLKKRFKQKKMSDIEVNTHYTAEDWDGFKALVEASDIEDKELVLRVLEMYPDAESREREIKNISAIFSQLADDILPKLRRSRLIANIQVLGKSDEEILDWIQKAPKMLSTEELLHAATLLKEADERVRIYQLIIKLRPKDYRAYNNIGAEMFAQGKFEMAKFWFNKAEQYAQGNYVTFNKGLVALLKGNLDELTPSIASATDVPVLGQALGYIYLKKGDYLKAERLYADTKTNNSALAYLLNRNYDQALQILDAVKQKNAMTYYLKAIVSARMQDKESVLKALGSAFKLDDSLVDLAEEDLEFQSYVKDADFQGLLQVALSPKEVKK